jgi:hypothetical protein
VLTFTHAAAASLVAGTGSAAMVLMNTRDPTGRRWIRSSVASLALAIALNGTGARAQTVNRTYLPDPADEDWSFLANAPKVDVWDPLKYIPLGREDWFATVSGQVRYRSEGFRVRRAATMPETVDTYLLQRYLTGADVHLGSRARVFVELQSGLITGRLQSPRPTDRNTLDLHQAFFERRHRSERRQRLSVKVGRQELAIGSTRLISASPGLNVKRSFDGVAIVYRTASWAFAGAGARVVVLNDGLFDDRSDSRLLFWGAAVSRRSPRFERGELTAYYLGIDRPESHYAQAAGPERRHTFGVKWSGTGTRFSLNYDALFQHGTFDHAPVRAWGMASETAYQLASAPWRPRFSVRADVASGDRAAVDPRLQAFNPLFPGNSYSGAVGLLGPTNLTDLTPAVTLFPTANVTIGIEAPRYWRTSTAEGLYATDLRLLVRPVAGTGKYVGTNPGVFGVWQVTPHWRLEGVVTRFVGGGFLQNTFIAAGFGFYSGSFVYRF